MKNKIYILIAVMFAFSSCSEDFLDQYPPQNITSGNFYQTEGQMILASNSVYNQLYSVWAAGALPYIYGDLYGGDSYVYITVGTASDWEDIGNTVAVPGNGLLSGAWNSSYKGIFLINDFLAELENFGMESFTTPGLGEKLMAEALFTRASFYFYLAQCFGDVPLVTEVLLPSEAIVLTRDPESEVVAQIEADLSYAAQNLPSSQSANDMGRPTSWAAKAMQARVFMAYGKDSEAASVLSDIINNGSFTLDADGSGVADGDDYRYIFHDNTRNCPASIFELQFIPGSSGKTHEYVQSYTPVSNLIIPGYDQVVGCWGLGAVPDALNDAFEPGDDDRQFISARMTQTNGTYAPHTRKYYYGYDDGTPFTFGCNVPIIRYAEILLNYAEVTDDPTYLNMVRDRYGLPGWGEAGYPTDLYPTFEDALLHERRVEFSFEFQRGFDLKRMGKFVEVKSAETGRTISDYMVHFPIPTAVLDVNKDMVQTTGY